VRRRTRRADADADADADAARDGAHASEATDARDAALDVEEAEAEAVVRQESDGGFAAELRVPRALHAALVGKGGARKRQLEAGTGATLHLPERRRGGDGGDNDGHAADDHDDGDGDGDGERVRMRGPTSQGVRQLRRRVESAAAEALESAALPYTHFVCLPLAPAAPAVQASFERLRDRMLHLPAPHSAPGLERSVFEAPQRLHLTVCMLKLHGQERLRAARRAMQYLHGLRGGRPLEVQLEGLAVMNDDPSAAHVLYCKVPDADGSRQALCDQVVQVFRRAGLLLRRDAARATKMHVTLVNTRYRRQRGGGGGAGPRRSVDCRALLQLLGDERLGGARVGALHLSQRGCSGPDGFYKCIHAAPL